MVEKGHNAQTTLGASMSDSGKPGSFSAAELAACRRLIELAACRRLIELAGS